MSVLDELRQERTYLRRESDFRAPAVTDLSCIKTGELRLNTLDSNEQYKLSATVSVTFWANNAQYDHARRAAEKVLLNRLYGDTLTILDEATKAIYGGDAKTALEAISAIRKNLLDPTQ